MLKNDRSELNYASLAKKARRLDPQQHGVKFRLALLADVSTQHLTPLLRALFASNGVDAEIYEAGYDTIALEALNQGSELYAFAPQAILILQSAVKLKGSFYHAAGRRSGYVQKKADGLESVWKAIRRHTAAVILQSTYVLPYERPLGNFGRLREDDLGEAIGELNRELCQRARQSASVLINDIDYIAGWVGRRNFFDEKLWGLAKCICALEFLPDVAQNIVDICLASIGRTVKCIVLDLDNTTWGGVVGDDGWESLILGDLDEDGSFRAFQLYIRELAARGIILAVCSKNNEEIAREVFQKHPGMVLREQDIAVFVANWDDKAANIRRIRETLNIGFDSMVFLDDNAFERNLVRQLIPEIIVPELPEDPALYVRAISELNLFETTALSSLDAGRAALYQDQQKRGEESKNFATVDEYLQSLQSVAKVRPFELASLGRIAQLIQRSNQFNLTTRRYSEAECQAMLEAPAHCFPFTISISDRFGDFGLINVFILRGEPGGKVLEIDTFLMSCRVLQRGVEQLAMNKIFAHARQGGFEKVAGKYLPTAKNVMVKSFFEKFGFSQTSLSENGATEWELRTDAYEPRAVFIEEAGPESL